MTENYSHLPLLFIFFDAGETLALSPVLRDLQSRNVTFKVIAMATAGEVIDIPPSSLIHLDQSHSADRYTPLPDDTIDRLASAYSVDIVISGMVSKAQHQLLHAFKAKQSQVITYYDPFESLKPTSIAFPFLDVADHILVPCETVATSIRDLSKGPTVTCVGHPTLEEWVQASLHFHHQPAAKKTILYLGGYGPDYDQAFSLFVDAIHSFRSHNIVVALHPKTSGAEERSILRAKGADYIRILPKDVSSITASQSADTIVTHRSSAGVHALFTGKPVIYLDIADSGYSNVAITKGLAPQVMSRNAFEEKLESFLSNPLPRTKNLYCKAGIPRYSSKNISDIINNNLVAI